MYSRIAFKLVYIKLIRRTASYAFSKIPRLNEYLIDRRVVLFPTGGLITKYRLDLFAQRARSSIWITR